MQKDYGKENTVSAENQMKTTSAFYCLGAPTAKKKILVIGNSITWHAPKEDIGWLGDWGMAASAPEKDFVHRLYALLTENGQDIYMRVSQAARWEINYFKDGSVAQFDDDRAFDADIVIIRLGENVALENGPYFKAAIKALAEHVCMHGKVIFTTCFWVNPTLDPEIRGVAAERGEGCVECGFSIDEKNMALGQFEHYGVSVHPSDAGMEKIAQAIFAELKE